MFIYIFDSFTTSRISLSHDKQNSYGIYLDTKILLLGYYVFAINIHNLRDFKGFNVHTIGAYPTEEQEMAKAYKY